MALKEDVELVVKNRDRASQIRKTKEADMIAVLVRTVEKILFYAPCILFCTVLSYLENVMMKERRELGMTETQLALLDATMDIVAEKGLDGFSMRQVTSRAGKADTSLYNYFGSKENLLYQCFLMVNRQISNLFRDISLPANYTAAQLPAFFRQQWERYFWFMVNNGNRSLFYYAYRESSYLQNVLMRNNKEVASDMEAFMTLIHGMLVNTKLTDKVSPDYVWLYLLEGTGMFVKQAIRLGYTREEINVNGIWLLLTGGMKALIEQ